MHIEEAEAQPLQLGVKLRAQFRHDFPLGQPRRDHVVGVGERRAQHRLRHNRQRQRRDNLQRRPARRRLPAERIHRRRQRRVQRIPDHVNHHAQQLESHDAEQQQHHAQHQRPQTIRAEPPRQRHQPADEFPRGISFVGGRVVDGFRHFRNRQNAPARSRNRIKKEGKETAMASRAQGSENEFKIRLSFALWRLNFPLPLHPEKFGGIRQRQRHILHIGRHDIIPRARRQRARFLHHERRRAARPAQVHICARHRRWTD